MEDGEKDALGPPVKDVAGGRGGWGGWGGWGTSALSVLSDLQKAASDVAEEISKNAVAAAKEAAKGVAELQTSVIESLEPVEEEETDEGLKEPESEVLSPEDQIRNAALAKLEGASQDSLFGQGLKVLDDSVETIASGALQALGTAWKGSVTFVHKLEHSAENLAGSIQQGAISSKAGLFAPNIIESGKALTAKGIKVLEFVGREAMDVLAAETGLEIEQDSQLSKLVADGDDQSCIEDVTFDHCFYIYGGPEQMEELEALSNHYTLLCNRAKTKLIGEFKVNFDATSKQLQQVLTLAQDVDEEVTKGKEVQTEFLINGNEMKVLRESSISKAAEMAAGFTTALGGLALKEVVQKTADRLEAIKAEGVHRLSELCAVCISHLVVLGKSVLTTSTSEEAEQVAKGSEFEWPEDCLGKASFIKARARAMAGDIEAVSDSFVTGIGDVNAAFKVAIKNESLAFREDGGEDIREGLLKEASIEDRAHTVRSDLESDASLAIEKVQDGIQHLIYVVLSTSFTT